MPSPPIEASLVGSDGKESAIPQETQVRAMGREDPLEKGMTTHSSILAWSIPWTVHDIAKSQTRLSNSQFHFLLHPQNGDNK